MTGHRLTTVVNCHPATSLENTMIGRLSTHTAAELTRFSYPRLKAH